MHVRSLFMIMAMLILVVTGCDLFDRVIDTGGPVTSHELVTGEVYAFTGTIIDTIDDCVFDGVCALIVEAEDGIVYVVNWAEGDMPHLCLGTFADNIDMTGQVAVTAMAVTPDRLSICPGEAYSIMPAR